jgi:hypothetical protein
LAFPSILRLSLERADYTALDDEWQGREFARWLTPPKNDAAATKQNGRGQTPAVLFFYLATL